ncbi:MAG: glycoside hydrolase family 2 TIM barrel-domain containing protein [Parvibaculales bacterium]
MKRIQLLPYLIGLMLVLVGIVLVYMHPTDVRPSKNPESDTEVAGFFETLGPSTIRLQEPHKLITNIAGRSVTSLNGKWNILVDEYDAGTSAFLGGPYYRLAAPVGDYELREYSLDERRQLSVPGDWNTQDDRLFRYRGTVWYARTLSLEKQTDKRYFLHFDGVNYDASVYVNGQPLGQHIGGYTAFNFEATNALVDGENLIVVRVNATLDDTTIPTKVTSDFFKYGGITRDVSLVTTPKTFIRNYSLALQDHETGAVKGWVQLDGDTRANKKVSVTVPEADIAITVQTDDEGRAGIAFQADLKLWSPDTPKLYQVIISAGQASLSDQIGFRTIASHGEKILLNGEPIFLRGIAMHDESYLKSGVAYDAADAHAQLGLIKQLNGNFVRLSHYPHNEHTLRMADALGLLVWSEIPIVSLIDWDNPESLAVAQNQIRDNIRRDRNRAAIVMWSIGNETMPQSPERLAFLKSLADTVREEDGDNRLIAAALIGDVRQEFVEVAKHLAADMVQSDAIDPAVKPYLSGMLAHMGVTDPSALNGSEIEVMLRDQLGEIVDVIGYNEYFGWYYAPFFVPQFQVDEKTVRDFMFPLMQDIRFRNAFGKPMVISEFGGGAKYGKRSDRAVLWSEEYQAKIYRHQLDMLARSPSVQGVSPWILKDFRSSLRNLNGIQDIYNRKGIISEKGEKKLAFEVLQDHYAERRAAKNASDNASD